MLEKWNAFWAAFVAVDNKVNEQTVVGTFWAVVALAMIITKIIGAIFGKVWVDLDTIIVVASMSTAAFGIGGVKKP